MQIMKQIDKQQKNQESFREMISNQQNNINQQKSRDNSNNQRNNNNNKTYYQESPLKQQNTSLINIQQQHHYKNNKLDVNQSIQSDNVVIDDEVMIFIILTKAATIIQNKFREYKQHKKQLINMQQQQDQKNKEQLSESTKLENRLIPVINIVNQQDVKRKTPKHTFSFGNIDDQQQQSVYQDKQKEQSPYKRDKQTVVVQVDNNSLRMDSSPVDDSHPWVFSGKQESVKNNQQFSQRQQQIEQQQQKQEPDYSSQDKFKFALRNLAEKQKKQNIFDQIKSQKQTSKSDHSQSIKQAHQPTDKKSNQQTNNKQQLGLINELEDINKTKSKQQVNTNERDQQYFISEVVPSSRKQPLVRDLNFEKEQQKFNQQLPDLLQNFTDDNYGDEIIDNQQITNEDNYYLQQYRNNNTNNQQLIGLNDNNFMSPNQQPQQLNKIDESILSSLLESKGEQTDKIILYSPINDTNEDILEQAVNQSNLINDKDESSESFNLIHQDYQSNLQNKFEDLREINIEDIELEELKDQEIFGKGLKKPVFKLPDLKELNNLQFNDRPMSERRHHVSNREEEEDQYQLDSMRRNQNNKQREDTEQKKKPILRLMFGDEKFLLDHDYDIQIGSVQETPREGSAPSTHRYQTSENPYFLQTNGSLFERNPFKDYTTHRLNDLLSLKNLTELTQLKHEALNYQEKLEKGLSNRKKGSKSPKSVGSNKSRRQQYEVEKWVSQREPKTNNLMDSRPINLAELEEERKEAAMIIEQVNQKAKKIKLQLEKDKQQRVDQHEEIIMIQDQKQSKDLIEHVIDDDKSSSHLDISIEEQKAKEDSQPLSHIPDLENLQIQQPVYQREHLPTVELEISIEEDDDDSEVEELKIMKSKSENQKVYENNQNLEYDSQRQKQLKQISDDQIQAQTDALTQQIFEHFLQQESGQILKLYQEVIDKQQKDENQKNPQSKVKIRPFIEEEKESLTPIVINKKVELDQSDNTKPDKITILDSDQQIPEAAHQLQKPLQVLQASDLQPSHSPQHSHQKPPRMGIDTTDEAIDDYVSEVFSQILARKEQFLQAFLTPIYKNPLEVLSNLQRPDFPGGEMENTMDFTNSLSYILNVQLYLTLEKARENLIHETIQELKRQQLLFTSSQQNNLLNPSSLNSLEDQDITDLLSEAQHIHNKVVFDSVNEALNSVRPYQNMGEPMPWSKKQRRNMVFMFENSQSLELILRTVKDKVCSWAKTRAGALPPRFEYSDQELQQQEEEHFMHQRERRLAHLLAQDLVIQEEKWLDYEMEETQVKIDLSDIILEHLVGETVDIINAIKAKNQY